LYGFAASQLCELEWRSGRWSEAASELGQLATLAETTGQPIATSYAHVHLAMLEAAQGVDEACRRHAGAAVELGDRLGMGAMSIRGHHALGLLALGHGDAAESAAHLDIVAATTRVGGTCQPGALWWQGDHVEALVECGRHDDAAAATDRLRREVTTGSSLWARGALHRAEALVTRDDVEDHLTRSIACFTELGAPFEQARGLLLIGEARLRAGRTAEGRRDLAAARRLFDGLRARPWSARSNAALARPTPAADALETRLSPAELRVTMAISNGDSNRQVAERLCVSVKTVDYHLQNIYRKLNVRNRTHLTRLVSGDLAGR
jgi:DNA-binding CsgD family transcriptional regulator